MLKFEASPAVFANEMEEGKMIRKNGTMIASALVLALLAGPMTGQAAEKLSAAFV